LFIRIGAAGQIERLLVMHVGEQSINQRSLACGHRPVIISRLPPGSF
jgi:hypothetical protein